MNEEQIAELARKVEVECLAVPGTSFHTVAQIAIEETIALLADGGNGEAVSVPRVIELLHKAQCTIPPLGTDVWTVTPIQVMWVIGTLLKGAPQAECAPICEHEWEAMTEPHKECTKCGEVRLAECAPREARGYITKDAVERSKRVMAAVDTYHERPDGGNRHELRSILMDEFEELLAAPTPERADAVLEKLQELTIAAVEMRDTVEAFYGGHADADTADHAALIAETIHWPEHWDTAAYPDVWSALQEVMHSFQCSECRLEPQAECAPREAQPVGPRTTLNYDGTFDTTCAHCGGNGCFACLKSAAPTPERADADTAGASDPVEQFLSEVHAELLRARAKFPGDRIMTIALAEEFGELCKAVLDEPAANVRKEAIQTAVMCARVVLDGDGSVNEWRAQKGLDPLVKSSFAAGASQERADAGKDAALTDEQIRDIWLRETGFDEQAAPFAILEFARAILAANKEPK